MSSLQQSGTPTAASTVEPSGKALMQTQCSTVKPESFVWLPCSKSHNTAHATSCNTGSKLAHIQHAHLLQPTDNHPSSTCIEDFKTLQHAADLLKQDLPVAIPTETVYGLAANALSATAVATIYAAKQRPADNPLIIHISSMDMLEALYPQGWTLPSIYAPIVQAHWPGPLTILLPKSDKVPECVTCSQPTMAVRMPAHPVARALIAMCGFPLAAPSANSSGRPSPTLAAHVLEDLAGRIPMVLDGGPCDCGIESTVLDGMRSPPVILRPGGVTFEQLRHMPGMEALQVYCKHFVDAKLEEAPTTPGMKYRHYSPNAHVTLIELEWPSAPMLPPPATASPVTLAPSPWSAAPSAASASAASTVTPAPAELAASAAHAMPHAVHSAHSISVVGATGAHGSGSTGCSIDELRSRLRAAANEQLQILQQQGFTKLGVLRTSADTHQMPGLQQQQHGEESFTQRQSGIDLQAALNGATMQAVANSSAPQPTVTEYVLGSLECPEAVAHELFRALRLLDELGVEAVVVEGVCEHDEGLAVMNRLRKAASKVVYL